MRRHFAQAYYNRRRQNRTRLVKAGQYQLSGGQSYRAEILNYSEEGARITTALNVNPEEQISLVCPSKNGISQRRRAIVKWVRPLACGRRQVVGVKIIQDASQSSRQKSPFMMRRRPRLALAR